YGHGAHRIGRRAVGDSAGNRSAISDCSTLAINKGAELSLPTLVERSRIDSRVIETGGVFGGVPERATVGVKRHRAVVAPAGGTQLRSSSSEEYLLGLAEGVHRITREATGIL